MCTQFVVAKGFLVAQPNLDLLIHNRIWLCSLEHFAPWGHFASQHCLLNTFCSLEHFAPQHSLLPRTLFSLEHFALNIFLALECRIDLGTFMFVCLDCRRSVRSSNVFDFRYVRWIRAVGMSKKVFERGGKGLLKEKVLLLFLPKSSGAIVPQFPFLTALWMYLSLGMGSW